MATKTKKRPKQKRLPGMENTTDATLEKLADEWGDLIAERMEVLKREITKRDLVFARMVTLGIDKYTTEGDWTLDLEKKLRRKKNAKESANGDGNE